MTTKSQELVNRADLALADLTANGGVLTPEQANQFIDYILDQPTMLPQVRVVRMNSPEVKINRLGFKTRILKAAPTNGGDLDAGGNDRYLRVADRSKPTTSQISLTSKEVIAEIRIPYEALEDNIEGRSMEEHIMRLIAQRAALDLEEWALWADTASSDPYLALANGWMKRASAHITDNANAGVSPDLFTNAQLALPQAYLKYLPQMRGYISMANTIKYRQKVSQRQTGYGDSALQNNIPLTAHGLTLEGVAALAYDNIGKTGLVTFPQNLIFGIRRDITVETDKDIRSREYVIVLTARVGLQMDDVDATVKMINI
jgi:HK97 family phage major capsid protein